MTQKINLNASPYYDDYDSEKEFSQGFIQTLDFQCKLQRINVSTVNITKSNRKFW